MNFSSSALSSDSSTFAIANASLPAARPASSFSSPDGSFASVLSQAKDSDSTSSSANKSDDDSDSDDDKKKKAAADAQAALTAEQLAAALALSAAAVVPPDPSASAPAADGQGGLSLANSKGRSISELLAQGTPVLNYNVGNTAQTALEKNAGSNAAAEATQPSAAAMPVPAPAAGSNDEAKPASNEPTESKKLSEKELATALSPTTAGDGRAQPISGAIKPTINSAVGPSGVTSPAALSAQSAGQEKFADGSGQRSGSGDDTSNGSGKNTSLVTDIKQLKKSASGTGTDAAIGGKPMTSDLHFSTQLATSVSSGASALGGATAASGDPSPTAATSAATSHAAALVHQIHEIGEGLWSADRQSVEVNFNFSEKEHLSVRVEYKNGQVQATFATNSTELRNAISHAWSAQNTNADSRSFKMADPIFSQSSSSFSSSGDSSNSSKQSSSSPEDSAFAGASRSRSVARTSSSSNSTAPVSSRANLRPEVAGRLNAIV